MAYLPPDLTNSIVALMPIEGIIATASTTNHAAEEVWNNKLVERGYFRVACSQGLWFIINSGMSPIDQLFAAINNGIGSHVEAIWRHHRPQLDGKVAYHSKIVNDLTPSVHRALVRIIGECGWTCDEAKRMFVCPGTLQHSDLVLEACKEDYDKHGCLWLVSDRPEALPNVILFAKKHEELCIAPATGPELYVEYIHIFLLHNPSYYTRDEYSRHADWTWYSNETIREKVASIVEELRVLVKDDWQRYVGPYIVALILSNAGTEIVDFVTQHLVRIEADVDLLSMLACELGWMVDTNATRDVIRLLLANPANRGYVFAEGGCRIIDIFPELLDEEITIIPEEDHHLVYSSDTLGEDGIVATVKASKYHLGMPLDEL